MFSFCRVICCLICMGMKKVAKNAVHVLRACEKSSSSPAWSEWNNYVYCLYCMSVIGISTGTLLSFWVQSHLHLSVTEILTTPFPAV